METKEKLELKLKILKDLEFREGGDYFSFKTNTGKEAEVQDITAYEFEGLIGEIIDEVEEHFS